MSKEVTNVPARGKQERAQPHDGVGGERRERSWAMFASLRVGNFRLYAGGQVVSLLGTWIQRIAQDWLVLEISGGSPVALGVAVALQFLPMPLLTLWAGVLADRLDKRRLLMSLQYGIGGCALVLGTLDLAELVQLWQVYVLCFGLGCCGALEMPVRQSFVMEMVGQEQVGNAVALNSMIVNSCRVVGPAIAGYLITLIGTGWLFLLNALSLVAVVATLATMDKDGIRSDSDGSRKRGQLVEGIRYVRHRSELMLVLLLVCCIGTFGTTFNTSLAVMAEKVFLLGSDGFGLLHTMLAIGTLSGAALAAWRSGRSGPRLRLLVGSALAFGLLEILAALAPDAGTFGAALIAVGAAQMTFILTANNTIQLSVDSALRGRVMALYMLLLLGGTPLGSTLAGWTAEHLDARSPLLIGGGLSVLAAVFCAAMLTMRSDSSTRTARHGEHSK
ncbi:Predicted arabinose efflux permease, MFS family [Actinopolyspora mzabensis]|uniref:Predicted arabinose efflux permease, MFS family n=1 Tax=Actinopolyspora mzabensis TaxID=995066 RepID=A0A1G8ZBX3_ACTMZ|nr:MFS transporter [Actinopolyspora mzabensis]SDK12527.1 Predicted arabinose efflux permease, MFS family [Actinopolyspora mzabensis]